MYHFIKAVVLVSFVLILYLQTMTARPLSSHEHKATQQPYGAVPKTKDSDMATEFPHTIDEPILHELDAALMKLANVYMQALFSGTHTAELEVELDALELRFYDLLDSLYREDRMSEYMKYEAEVTHQMIIYNLLKRLFGYAKDDAAA
ncbi:PREDICTED: uncharacterized protein LOC108970739 isoform X2 [Bactrocera latifrons]|uniref:uncharacterized protein LOC108970739 isoform X2 n=1 Tax=Bactrocera latifrons TaxID=174628 RepID=UPI0008DC6E75|nr:PREDICTED: uncharacterized protein LOC108970739 isoform X2 [Bactrocera latifrons]